MSKESMKVSAARRPMSRIFHRGRVCEPDPIDPDRVPCSNPVLLDDRQGISHFFGRNKRATATIPIECYPLQCRTHYQERKYRMRDRPGAEAAYQCDSIMLTLQRMPTLTWTDNETKTTWPRFIGFELQVCKSGGSTLPKSSAKATASTSSAAPTPDVDITPFPEVAAKSGGKAKPPAPIPSWLINLCSKSTANQTFISIGDRNGARYTMPQLAQIVRAMKTHCIDQNARLPAVEALPITLGIIYEAHVAEAKLNVEAARREHHIAVSAHREAVARGSRNCLTLQRAMEGALGDLEAAQAEFQEARDDLAATAETLPVKRVTKKSKGRLNMAVAKGSDDDGKDVEIEDV